MAEGVNDFTFVGAVFVNGAAGGFAAHVWIYILLNLMIGLSCALPAYLYSMVRNKERIGAT